MGVCKDRVPPLRREQDVVSVEECLNGGGSGEFIDKWSWQEDTHYYILQLGLWAAQLRRLLKLLRYFVCSAEADTQNLNSAINIS